MKILIVGCGYVGKALAFALLERGDEVWGLRRDVHQLKELEYLGLKPLSASLLNPNSLTKLPKVDVVIFCQAPSREADNYEDTYYLGTKNLLAMLGTPKPKKIILISSTSVYGTRDGSWVDEDDNPKAAGYENKEQEENAKHLLATEQLALASGIPANVLRLGGIYGPGRHRLQALKDGRIRPSFSDIYINRIHVEDIVGSLILLIEKGKPGEIYLGVDDTPSTQKEFYEWIYAKLSLSKPSAEETKIGSVHGSNKRCANKKIKRLGMKLKYPSYCEGYALLFREIH